jgi:cobaltochelatase CobT
MAPRNPIAFLSYVRDDDHHDFGGVTTFRERLEGEVKVQSGQRFEIFQDRNDIRWGQFWQERIIESLSEVTFLIPIITPSFLVSPSCRTEFETFIRMEQTLGLNKLILPVYYVSCDAIDAGHNEDSVVAAIRKRNWTDWRPLRFMPFDSSEVRSTLAQLAKNIKSTMQELTLIAEAAQHPKIPKEVPESTTTLQREADTVSVFQKLSSPPWSKGGVANLTPPPEAFYWAYTLEFDETIAAAQLMGGAGEAIQLQSELSKQVASIKRRHAKFFKSVRTITLANQENDLAVTLLLDNSGSLRGSPIVSIAAWTVILSEWFDIAGIKHEILGYTTRSWKGGGSRDKWLTDGKSQNPGRLCDLRHIVYKSFDEPASKVAANCAIMMREGLLKENVDGEALLWANARLEKEVAARKILFVVSDGAPVDDSTLTVNPANFLSKHLSAAAGWIEQTKLVELRGIGANYDGPYFTNHQKVEPRDIGVPILKYVLKVSPVE